MTELDCRIQLAGSLNQPLAGKEKRGTWCIVYSIHSAVCCSYIVECTGYSPQRAIYSVEQFTVALHSVQCTVYNGIVTCTTCSTHYTGFSVREQRKTEKLMDVHMAVGRGGIKRTLNTAR